MRYAIMVGTEDYPHARNLDRLLAPANDVEQFGTLLSDPRIGGFQVTPLVNRPLREVSTAIEDRLLSATEHDTILIYISGHGILTEDEMLHFPMTDIEADFYRSGALSAQVLKTQVDLSRAKSVIVLLDCCYSGAYFSTKAEGGFNLDSALVAGGEGRVVITATTGTHAFEPLAGGNTEIVSYFTQALIAGLSTGDADRGGDGLVDTAELYQFVHEWLLLNAPGQKPVHRDESVGKIVIARNARGFGVHPELPPQIQRGLQSDDHKTRAAVLGYLQRLAEAPGPEQYLAQESLTYLRKSADHNDQIMDISVSTRQAPTWVLRQMVIDRHNDLNVRIAALFELSTKSTTNNAARHDLISLGRNGSLEILLRIRIAAELGRVVGESYAVGVLDEMVGPTMGKFAWDRLRILLADVYSSNMRWTRGWDVSDLFADPELLWGLVMAVMMAVIGISYDHRIKAVKQLIDMHRQDDIGVKVAIGMLRDQSLDTDFRSRIQREFGLA
ncbi:caspase family protein [Nocardia sp. NPDC055165]